MPQESKIRRILINRGNEIFKNSCKKIDFAKHTEADRFLANTKRFPHAFVIGCLVDRQIKAEKAWRVPYELSQRIGGFSFSKLKHLKKSQFVHYMSKPESLHRYTKTMGELIFLAIQHIAREYKGDAANIWKGRPSSSVVVYRFLQFKGVGQKIATMAANILARHYKVKFSDYYSIDISVDVHIRRVFRRLGLTPEKASQEQIIFRAKSLSPDFPGLLDMPAWEIGRTWCRQNKPLCDECYMRRVCPNS